MYIHNETTGRTVKGDRMRADGPRAKRESRRREEIRSAILLAAERIINAKGYTAMSMDDLAREAGLSKATVYKYVPSKGRILFEIISHHLDTEGAKIQAIADSGRSASEKLRAIVVEIIGFYQAKRNIARMLLVDKSLFRFLRLIYGGNVKAAGDQIRRKIAVLRRKGEELSRIIARVLEEGSASGEFRPVDARETVFLIDALLAGISHPRLWEDGMAEVPADRLAEKIFDFIISGLRKPKGEA